MYCDALQYALQCQVQFFCLLRELHSLCGTLVCTRGLSETLNKWLPGSKVPLLVAHLQELLAAKKQETPLLDPIVDAPKNQFGQFASPSALCLPQVIISRICSSRLFYRN